MQAKMELIRYILTAYNCSIYHAVVAYQYAGQTEYNRTFAERVENYFITRSKPDETTRTTLTN